MRRFTDFSNNCVFDIKSFLFIGIRQSKHLLIFIAQQTLSIKLENHVACWGEVCCYCFE